MTESKIIVQNWLRELSFKTGGNFTLNDLNECYVKNEGGVQLTISAPTGSLFYISSALGLVPDSRSFLYAALAKNLFQNETKGASLAIDPTNDGLLLCYSNSVEKIEYLEFENIISNLFEVAAKIKEDLYGIERLDKTGGVNGQIERSMIAV